VRVFFEQRELDAGLVIQDSPSYPMRLTRDEILLISFITVALVAGAVVKNYRARDRMARPAGVAAP
jgi:hypothetical protein